jgi:hypothetical protein
MAHTPMQHAMPEKPAHQKTRKHPHTKTLHTRKPRTLKAHIPEQPAHLKIQKSPHIKKPTHQKPAEQPAQKKKCKNPLIKHPHPKKWGGICTRLENPHPKY